MVGLVEPNSSKPSDKPKETKIEEYFSNPLQIRVPAKGKYSPYTDERCFTWCSQSARGRYEGQEPWCRSICIRRVFEHEVQRLTSHFSRDSAFQLHAAASARVQAQSHHPPSGSGSSSCLSSTTRTDAERFPLPQEGQPESAVANDVVGGPRTRDVRYWQEGWYIWATKSPWAVQERVELMSLDLERQTEWMRVKEQERRSWAEGEQERNAQAQAQDKDLGVNDGAEQDTAHERHPYLVAAEESFLMRIPTRLPPLDLYAKRTFAPTWKVLGITRESIASGHQKDLALHAWELVQEGAPFRLVKNVFKTCFSSFGKKQDN